MFIFFNFNFLIFIDAQASAPTGVDQGSRGSADVLSRTYNMTLDEAALILNLKKGTYTEPSELQQMLKVFPLPLFWLLLPRNTDDGINGVHRISIIYSQPINH